MTDILIFAVLGLFILGAVLIGHIWWLGGSEG